MCPLRDTEPLPAGSSSPALFYGLDVGWWLHVSLTSPPRLPEYIPKVFLRESLDFLFSLSTLGIGVRLGFPTRREPHGGSGSRHCWATGADVGSGPRISAGLFSTLNPTVLARLKVLHLAPSA